MKQPCVYILASERNGTLYVGVTSNLVKRVWEHKSDLVGGFTKRYGVHTLVWYEGHETMASAIARERAIKEWRRAVEAGTGRGEESGVAGPVRGTGLSGNDVLALLPSWRRAAGDWIPAFAGMTMALRRPHKGMKVWTPGRFSVDWNPRAWGLDTGFRRYDDVGWLGAIFMGMPFSWE